MIVYPIAKINLGLLITEKRADGFHNLETIFYPVPVQDALEVVHASEFQISITGIDLQEDPTSNLVVKAYLNALTFAIQSTCCSQGLTECDGCSQ